MRWILAALLCCGPLCAAEFDIIRKPAVRALFQAQESPTAPEADVPRDTLDEILAASGWRDLGMEAWVGLIAAKRSMLTAGLGLEFNLDNSMSMGFRLDYNNDVGQPRDFRPQVRGATLETTVIFHLDFARDVAFYTGHGINATIQLAYFKLDEAIHGTELGVVTSIGAGTVNTAGLEFGTRNWRGFAETGLRTQIMITQSANEESVEGYKDDVRRAFTIQWIVARIGVRYYF